MKAVFTSPLPHRNSAQVLGVQTSEALRVQGYNAQFVPFSSLQNTDADVVMFCKFFDEGLMQWCKSTGKKVVWFPDEALFGPHMRAALNSQALIDCIVSTCEKYTEKLRDCGFSHPAIEVIHHHHCNFKNQTVPFREEVAKVAYVGEPTQMHHQDGVAKLCRELGVEFIVKREHAKDYEDFEDIDIALAFIDPKSNNHGLHAGETSWQDRLDYRSNCKIVNYAAFGIPAVVSRYASYAEVAKPYEDFCLFVDNPQQLEEGITSLVKDTNLRRSFREAGLAMRDDYHILNLQARYREVFKALVV